jgi:hypothetical protein
LLLDCRTTYKINTRINCFEKAKTKFKNQPVSHNKKSKNTKNSSHAL